MLTGSADFNATCMYGAGKDASGGDINECLNNMGVKLGMCHHGKCVNMEPGFKCRCNSGFKNHPDDDHICLGEYRAL